MFACRWIKNKYIYISAKTSFSVFGKYVYVAAYIHEGGVGILASAVDTLSRKICYTEYEMWAKRKVKIVNEFVNI